MHRRLRRTIAALWIIGGVSICAHDLPRSESVVIVRGPEVRARLTLDLLELGGVDVNHDDVISYGELDDQMDRVYALIKQHYTVTSDAPLTRMSAERSTIVSDHVLQMDLLLVFASTVTQVTVGSTFHKILKPDHEHVTRVTIGNAARSAVLFAGNPEVTVRADDRSDAAPASMRPWLRHLIMTAAAAVGAMALFFLVRRSR
jgi:hypothetical protein